MSKLVVLNLGKGSLQEGFNGAIAQIYQRDADYDFFPTQFTGSLPAAPELTQLYRRWQILYNLLYDSLIPDLTWRMQYESDDEIEIELEDVTNISSVEFNKLCEDLKHKFNLWLNCPTFVHLEQKLRTKLSLVKKFR